MKDYSIEVCNCIDTEIVHNIKDKILSDDELIDLSEFFKIFGDSTRIKIINVLINGEVCVCDIAYILNMTHSAISHQLKILKQSKIVRYRKVGKMVYYSLDDSHITEIFNKGVEHIEE